MFSMKITSRGKPTNIGETTFFGDTVEEVATNFCDFRDRSGYGASQLGGMNNVKDGRKIVAKISYNGRIWPAK